jgi:acetyl esterase/lipase
MKLLVLWLALLSAPLAAAEKPLVQALWPREIPGPPAVVDGEERDVSKPDDRLIAGRKIIRLSHVKTPQAHIFLPPKEKANGGGVVICPGGGFSVLAWDLEGTEVAEWLNSLGYAAVVVKYRTPTRQHGETLDPRHPVPLKAVGPVADAQRGVSLMRSMAKEWNLDPERIGVLGFSAGGQTAGLTALLGKDRVYEPQDKSDESPCHPNFALLIYPGGFLDRTTNQLPAYIKVTPQAPPTFFVMAEDDNVNCENCTLLFTALKREKVPAELHIYTHGGHGYGLRQTDQPVTRWTRAAEDWLKAMELHKRS